MVQQSPSLFGLPSLVAILLLTGCGESGPELGLVSGTVTNAQGPVAGATVEFHPESGRPSYGTTAADGKYQLAFTSDRPGAMLGSHRIRVSISNAGAAPAGAEEVLEVEPTLLAVPTPVTVEPGENTIDVDLTKAVAMGRSGGAAGGREVLEPPSR